MPRFSKILCAVQFDENSKAALELACSLANENDATLYLLHVASIPNADMDVPVAIPNDPRWERAARAKLEQLAPKTLKGKAHYEIHVTSGIPDEDVVREANRLGPDLIVMATHGRKGFRHLVLGSVAESVIREAPCPVLIVGPLAGGAKRSGRRANATKR